MRISATKENCLHTWKIFMILRVTAMANQPLTRHSLYLAPGINMPRRPPFSVLSRMSDFILLVRCLDIINKIILGWSISRE